MEEGTIKKVRLSDMVVDPLYQRAVNEAKVRRIIREFDPAQVRPICVSHRHDGRYYILDGQHTAEALRRRNGKNATALCIVFEGMTFIEENALWSAMNTNSTKPRTIEMLHAAYTRGEPEVTAYIKILERAGVPWEFSNGQKRKMTCHAAGMTIRKRYGDDILYRTLCIAKAAYGGMNDAYTQYVLGGVSTLLHTFPDADDDRVEMALIRLSPLRLKSVDSEYKITIHDKKTAEAFLIGKIYNKGLRNRRLDLNKLFAEPENQI